MNEWLCMNCGCGCFSDEKPDACACGNADFQQACPMCGSIIDCDTKVCPECKEAVA